MWSCSLRVRPSECHEADNRTAVNWRVARSSCAIMQHPATTPCASMSRRYPCHRAACSGVQEASSWERRHGQGSAAYRNTDIQHPAKGGCPAPFPGACGLGGSQSPLWLCNRRVTWIVGTYKSSHLLFVSFWLVLSRLFLSVRRATARFLG